MRKEIITYVSLLMLSSSLIAKVKKTVESGFKS